MERNRKTIDVLLERVSCYSEVIADEQFSSDGTLLN